MFSFPCPIEGLAHWRLTLDTEQDRQLFIAVADALDRPLVDCRFRDVVELLRRRPDLLAINTPL